MWCHPHHVWGVGIDAHLPSKGETEAPERGSATQGRSQSVAEPGLGLVRGSRALAVRTARTLSGCAVPQLQLRRNRAKEEAKPPGSSRLGLLCGSAGASPRPTWAFCFPFPRLCSEAAHARLPELPGNLAWTR